MAEQTSHDAVNQTRSGGDASPSDGPASKPDNYSAEGGGEGVQNKNDEQIHSQRESSSAQGNNSDETSMHAAHTDGQHNERGSKTDQPSLGATTSKESATETSNVNGIVNKLGGRSPSPNVADGSGGSDTDASRVDSRATAEGSQQSRTSSTKRPTSFKPVSFAKFNPSKSPGPAAATKAVTDKASFSSSPSTAPVQQTSRPRLVVKSTSGFRDSTPRSIGGGKAGSSAPDPGQVWNKNRPVQPAPTKHLTDEELKQQYGIHMTSRLQADNDGKEAKWADIDDDEDDWAPDTIEWTDGTKITLGHTESFTQPKQLEPETKEKAPSPPKLDANTAENNSSKTLIANPLSTPGSNTTIFKVGGHAEKQPSKPTGDVPKGSSEKPTLVQKGAAAPVKSPWAPLPPVDRVPPVNINPPPQKPQASRFFNGERSTPEASAVPPPPKEIAADDFNRSWRDAKSSGPKELYNSQSGRYEPVVEGRRNQHRSEPFRPSSLLQRPTHHEQSGPAEPSPAFQTHRISTAQDGAPWGRRRASSNVSGGSGAGFNRRTSINKPDVAVKNAELAPSRLAERSVSPRRAVPEGAPEGFVANAPYRVSVNNHYASPGQQQLASRETEDQGAEFGDEDPIAMQQRIMREKRELARQRRKEEEEREEAAKRERIRLKLEALGPPPVKQKQTTTENTKQTVPTTVIQSPPKPPIPEPSGEPKQYGMMKVHHPDTVKKMIAANDRNHEKSIGSGAQGRKLPLPKEQKDEHQQPDHRANGAASSKEPAESQIQPTEPHLEAKPHVDEKPSQWKATMPSPGSFPSWNGSRLASPAAPSGSVWSPPNGDRALGNGTFDRNLTSFPPQDMPSGGSLAFSEQLEVGSTTASGDRTGASERLQGSLHGGSKEIADSNENLSPLPSPEKRTDTLHAAGSPKLNARPGPIAPPTAAYSQRRQPDQLAHRNAATAAWHNFHSVASRVEAEESERFRRELVARREEEARTGIAPSLQATFKETWRQVDPGSQAGQRTIVDVTRTTIDTERETSLSSLQNLDSSVAGLQFPQSYSKPPVTTPSRGSRFFPQGPEQNKVPSNEDVFSTRSVSPPPPEEISSHPVFAGDSHRPLVHLPSPKPRVKLPPRNTRSSPPPTFSAVAAANPPPFRTPARPIVSSSVWQDRFNGLFGKKTSQTKASSLAVTSATKEPFDVQSSALAAAVSLPRDELRDSGKVTSKEVEEEEAIFEDREAGSLPVVRLPDMPPLPAWRPAPPPSHSRFRPKYQKPVQSLSIEPYNFGELSKDNAGNVVVVIRLPGKDIAKSLPWPTAKTGGLSSRQRPNQSYKHRKGGRSRDGAGSHHSAPPGRKVAASAAVPASLRPRPQTGNWASRVSATHS
ncbi:hypothetical protein VTO42DRAFT_8823 [Malbranchea cinnamomea]